MKTNRILNRISKVAFLAATLLAAPFLTGCSSDSEPTPDPIPDGMARVNLSIATPRIETRAGNDADIADGETDINSLWVYFYQINGSTSTLKYAFDITANGQLTDIVSNTSTGVGTGTKPTDLLQTSSNSNNEEYTTIISGLNMEKGIYHVYVLANIADDYIGTQQIKPSSKPAETTLQSTVLSLGNVHNSLKFTNGKAPALPMAANYTDVSITGSTDGNLNIEGSATIKADMTFLVSKVRYTIFFDGTHTGNTYGYSYPYETIEFKTPTISNVAQSTNLFGGEVENMEYNDESSNFQGPDAVYIPGEMTFDNFYGSSTFVNNFTTAATATNSKYSGHVACQRVFYISENLSTVVPSDEDDENSERKSTVLISVELGSDETTGDAKDYLLVLPNKSDNEGAGNTLTRGNFYDIMGKITADGFDFQVKVRKWVKAANRTSGEL